MILKKVLGVRGGGRAPRAPPESACGEFVFSPGIWSSPRLGNEPERIQDFFSVWPRRGWLTKNQRIVQPRVCHKPSHSKLSKWFGVLRFQLS